MRSKQLLSALPSVRLPLKLICPHSVHSLSIVEIFLSFQNLPPVRPFTFSCTYGKDNSKFVMIAACIIDGFHRCKKKIK